MVLIYKITGSKLSFGMVMLFKLVPPIIVNSFVGVFIDRYNKKSILLWADITRCIVFVCLIAFYKFFGAYFILIILLIATIITGIYLPTRSAIIPQVLQNKSDISQAYSYLSMSMYFIAAISPAIGGIFLMNLGPDITLLVDALTFLISAILLYSVNLIDKLATVGHKTQIILSSFIIELKYGIKTVLISNELLNNIIVYSLWQIAYGILHFAVPLLLFEYFKTNEAIFGFQYSILGIGSVFGIIIIKKYLNVFLNNKDYLTKLILYSSFTNGILISLSFFSKTIYIFFLIWFLSGIIMKGVELVLETNILIKSPIESKGRVQSLFHMSFRIGMALGALIGMSFVNIIKINILGLISGFIIFFAPMAIYIPNMILEQKEIRN
jgi:predicted MFS family arabinose efflux permease